MITGRYLADPCAMALCPANNNAAAVRLQARYGRAARSMARDAANSLRASLTVPCAARCLPSVALSGVSSQARARPAAYCARVSLRGPCPLPFPPVLSVVSVRQRVSCSCGRQPFRQHQPVASLCLFGHAVARSSMASPLARCRSAGALAAGLRPVVRCAHFR